MIDLSKWNQQLAANGPYLSGMDRTIGDYTLYIRNNYFILTKKTTASGWYKGYVNKEKILEVILNDTDNLAHRIAMGEKKWLTYIRKYCIIVCNTDFLT